MLGLLANIDFGLPLNTKSRFGFQAMRKDTGTLAIYDVLVIFLFVVAQWGGYMNSREKDGCKWDSKVCALVHVVDLHWPSTYLST